MIKKLTGQVVAIALGVILVSSCSKSDSPSVDRKTAIIGSWKISAEALDLNKNGKIEANENFLTDTSWAHIIYTYKANGTRTEAIYTDTSYATWTLESNNTVLKTVDTGFGGGTIIDQILDFTATTFKIKNTDTSGLSLYVTYTKQ
jgi:hypothetical protein